MNDQAKPRSLHPDVVPFNVGLKLFPPETCLASVLARALTAMPVQELRRTQVIIPTSRLANRVSAVACQIVGAWYEPQFLTFESFVNVHAQYCTLAPLPIGADDAESTLLLGHLIRSSKYRHINRSHIGELKQLYNEFADWRFGVEGFDRIRQVLAENTFRSDEAIANLFERVDEAEDLYNRFTSELGSKDKISGRGRQVQIADLLTRNIEHGLTPQADRILMVGITSIMPWSHSLLAAMAKHWPLQVWAPTLPKTESDSNANATNPVTVLTTVLDFPPDQIEHMKVYEENDQDEPVKHQVAIHHASDVFAETAAALNLVQQGIDANVLPADIGILVTNDHEYGRPLRLLLKQHPGLGFNAAITKPFSSSLTGSWLASLKQLQSRGEDAASLTSFLTHAVTIKKLHQLLAVQQRQSSFSQNSTLREDIIRELCAAGIESGVAETAKGIERNHPPLALAINSLHQQMLPFLSEKSEFSLTEWSGKLAEALTWFAPQVLEDPTRPGLRLSIQSSIEAFLHSLSSSVICNERFDVASFFDIVSELLLAGDIRDTGDQLKGVQILSVEEARFIPFKLLLILGCNEGSFPRSLPKDYLFDNFLKTKIGLPGWQAVEAIEDSTFQLLKARTTNLHLLFTENPNDGLKIRSRFIDDIKQSDASLATFRTVNAPAELHSYVRPKTTPSDKLEQAVVASTEDRRNRYALSGLFHGDRPALLEKLSATSLESLIKCPYRFLLRQLGVRELDLPEEDDKRKEGDWLHGVLEAFFTGFWNDKEMSQPLDTSIASDQFYQYAVGRLDMLTTAICPVQLAGTETWVQAKTIGWPAFAKHITKLYAEGGLERIGLGRRELKYKSNISLGSDKDSFNPVLRGKIDSIDLPLPGVHLVTDYKRSSMPEKNAVISGFAPQLTLYAAALASIAEKQKLKTGHTLDDDIDIPDMSLSNTIIGYWSILKGEFSAVAAGSAVRTQADALGLVGQRSKVQLEDVFTQLRQLISQRKQELLEAPAIVPDTKDCSFCSFSGICRKDEPEFRRDMRSEVTS